MDDKSLEILEFPKVKEILAAETSFSGGRDLALGLEPHSQRQTVTLLLRQSSESRHLLALHPSASVGDVTDVRQACRMAKAGRTLDAAQLVFIQRTLASTCNLRVMIEKASAQVPSLWDIARGITRISSLESDIATSIAQTGDVLDSASPQLAGIRFRLRVARRELLSILQGFIVSNKGHRTVQDPIVTERDGRYVLSIKAELRKEVAGIVHDVSNTGQTVFVEPMLTVETGNELRQLVAEERQEILRVLSALSVRVGDAASNIIANVDAAAELDLAFAKARYAQRVSAIEPLVGDSDEETETASKRVIRLVRARHPLLKGKVVPLSVEFGGDNRVLVISGPNTGGKTVALKTIGLLVVMTQAGIPVPAAEGTRLPVFDNVFADVGDEQSIERTLSTFSWHMGNIIRILRQSTEKSLVLLDELGASTDPGEGTALAKAVLLHLRDRETVVVATTHYTEIKMAARTHPGLENASLDFDPHTLSPTYQLTLGVPGDSNAMAIAAQLGLPPEIISRAKEMMSGNSRELETILRNLTLEKQQVADLRARLTDAMQKAEADRKAFLDEQEHARKHAAEMAKEALSRIVDEADELRKEIRLATTELRKTVSKNAVDRARHSMVDFHRKLSHIRPVFASHSVPEQTPDVGEGISVGDRVKYGEAEVEGIVKAFDKENNVFEIEIGNVHLRTDAGNVKLTRQSQTESHRIAPVRRPIQGNHASSELDLRGKRADEVEFLLDAYLNNAFLAHLAEVRIINGMGTGTVRQIVREVLSVHPLIKSFRPGGKGEGGDGVTMATLAHE